jgi:hypothetical protein
MLGLLKLFQRILGDKGREMRRIFNEMIVQQLIDRGRANI